MLSFFSIQGVNIELFCVLIMSMFFIAHEHVFYLITFLHNVSSIFFCPSIEWKVWSSPNIIEFVYHQWTIQQHIYFYQLWIEPLYSAHRSCGHGSLLHTNLEV